MSMQDKRRRRGQKRIGIATSQRARRPPLSCRRRWVFRSLAIAIPLLLVMTIELAARVFGIGPSTKFLIRERDAGGDYWRDNPRFTEQFFPAQVARAPHPFRAAAVEAEDAYRIVLLGSSAAMGDPDPSYGMGRCLEAILRARFPGHRIEVVNCAVTGINSHVVRRIVEHLEPMRADAYLLYEGNNETIGPYGPGTVFEPLGGMASIRFRMAVKSTKLGQLASALAARVGQRDRDMPTWGLELFKDMRIAAGSDELDIVYRHFRLNLESIVKTSRRRGIPLLLATVAVNTADCPPFASLHREGLDDASLARWETFYRQGLAAAERRELENARLIFEQAGKIDDTHAELQYAWARTLEEAGDLERADESYIRAMNLDACRLRSDTRMNEIVREVASLNASTDVSLVDIDAAFHGEAGRLSAGRQYFLDHVHFNFDGNWIAAREFADVLSPTIASWAGVPAATIQPDTSEAHDLLAFTQWDEARVLLEMLRRFGRPPYTDQLRPNPMIASCEERLRTLQERPERELALAAIETYRKALQTHPEDFDLRQNFGRLLQAGQLDVEAIEQLKKAVEARPHAIDTLTMLGNAYASIGRPDVAEQHYLRALRMDPHEPAIYNNLGRVTLAQGRPNDALSYYRKVLRWRRGVPSAHHNVAHVLKTLGRVEKSIESYRRVVELAPQSVEARVNLGDALLAAGRREEALAEYRQGLRLSPEHDVLKSRVGLL